MREDRPPCRCLLKDSEPDLARVVGEYVDSLPDTARAPAPEQERRLAVCLTCAHLIDGTCALCGCYVEARAAKQSQRCPDVPDRWAAMGHENGADNR